MTQFSGELPPELVSIVKEFSRPLLRYPREYREASRELKQELKPMVLESMKRGLSGPNADEVLKYLQFYLTVHRLEVQARKQFMKFIIHDDSVHVWGEAIILKSRMYNKLMELLY
jgi:hypothetical protein